jgi:hypothetical protein
LVWCANCVTLAALTPISIHALALVGDGFLGTRDRLVVLVAVLVHVDFDPLHAGLGLGQDGTRFEFADSLLERLDSIEQRLRIGRRSRRADDRFRARHFESLKRHVPGQRLVGHHHLLRRPFEAEGVYQQHVLTGRHFFERKLSVRSGRRRPVGRHPGHVRGHRRGTWRRKDPQRDLGTGDDATPGVGNTATDCGSLGRRFARHQQDGGASRGQTESAH